MSVAQSPSSSHDYVIVQPPCFHDLPLRLKTPEHHHDNHNYLSEDEFEYISSPDAVRSLSSTPVPHSVITDDELSECSEDDRYEAASGVAQSSSISPARRRILPCTLDTRCPYSNYDPNSVPPQLRTRSIVPPTSLPPRYPYVYTAPSEDGYPGTGVLSNQYPKTTADAENRTTSHRYGEPATVDKEKAEQAYRTALSYQKIPCRISRVPELHCNPLYSVHNFIDVRIMDQLIDSVCRTSSRNNWELASPDTILRHQMLKRLRDLPPDHSVRKEATQPFDFPKSYQNPWPPYEKRSIYNNIFTNVERVALSMLVDIHMSHLKSECLFADIGNPGYVSQNFRSPAGRGTCEAGQGLALNAQSYSLAFLSGRSVDTVFRSNELRITTANQVNREGISLCFSASPSEIDEAMTDSTPFDLCSIHALTDQAKRDHLIKFKYFHATALKRILNRTLIGPPFAPPRRHALDDYQRQLSIIEEENKARLIKERELKAMNMNLVPPPRPMRININSPDNQALQDYQMQLMLLEQQDIKRTNREKEKNQNRKLERGRNGSI